MRTKLEKYQDSGDWSVWIGSDFVIASYDSMHTLFNRVLGVSVMTTPDLDFIKEHILNYYATSQREDIEIETIMGDVFYAHY